MCKSVRLDSIASNFCNNASSDEHTETCRRRGQYVDFYYRDLQTGHIMGPYVQSQMQEWYENTDFISEDSQISTNGGASFSTLKQLIYLYGLDHPFCVEDNFVKLTANNRFYYRKHPSLPASGPFSDDEVKCFYEKGVFNSYGEIAVEGMMFIPLGEFVTISTKPWASYRYDEQLSSSRTDHEVDSSNHIFYYREAAGYMKGPFSREQMQSIYANNLLEYWQSVQVSCGYPNHFVPLATYMELNGWKYPFGRELSVLENDDCGPTFNYIDNGVKGDFVKAQMQCWYERGVFNKNTKVSTNKKRFMTLGQLIERNGEERPFYGEDCEVTPQHELDVEDYEELYYRTSPCGPSEGPFAKKQMQYFYESGRFNVGDFLEIGRGRCERFQPLKELIVRNGRKNPFKGNFMEQENSERMPTETYYYQEAPSKDIKGPFVPQQMQKWYEDGIFNFGKMRFSKDGKSFFKLKECVKQNGEKFPFCRSEGRNEKTGNKHKGYFYRDGEIRGPFVEAQMKEWYDKKIFGEKMEISVDDGNNFLTLHELVEMNGNFNPFSLDYENSEEEKDGMDLFHLRYSANGECLGPFVEDQLQMWYIRGWFDERTEVSKNYGEFRTLNSLMHENGRLYPFSYDKALSTTTEEVLGNSESSEDSVLDTTTEEDVNNDKEPSPLEASEDSNQMSHEYVENWLELNGTLKRRKWRVLHGGRYNKYKTKRENWSHFIKTKQDYLMEQASPIPTTVNWFAIMKIVCLFIICDVFFQFMSTTSRTSQSKFRSYFWLLFCPMINFVQMIIAIAFTLSRSMLPHQVDVGAL